MKIRTQYIVLAAAVVVLSLYIAFRPSSRIGYQLPALPEISEDDLASISYQIGSGESILLEQHDGTWLIQPEGYKADPSKIAQVMRFLENGAFTDLAAASAPPERFGLDEAKQTTLEITFASGASPVDLRFGKGTPGNAYTYAALPDTKEVYLWRGNVSSALPKDRLALRDRRLTDQASTDVTGLRFQVDGRTTERVLNEDKAWVDADGTADDEVANVLTRIIGLRAKDFVETPAAAPLASWDLITQDGQTTYHLYPSTQDGEYILDSDYSDSAVSVSEASLKDILQYLGLAAPDSAS